ncbi:Pc21g15780 [Penicillium rubens Wisconsin 54-1255]|uniref:Pc21g15780 protein n=1 Tax=Penicillium rubens (strain ATCC 28089 / DSM 1075 / NRRL 1951 / Wisconsin 54-1255) TaxID=500485 RepID=B6HK74_PENRW|nr:Pc21g15780 [Penicillium rubens Wisconsin 54-1255]
NFLTLSKDKFDIAKEIYLLLIENYYIANKYKLDVKTYRKEESTILDIKDYILGLIFNLIYNTTTIIYIVYNLNYFYYKYTNKKVKWGNINSIYIKIKGLV